LLLSVCFAASAAGQASDSLAVARRIAAATSLAVKEYVLGVAPRGGRVTAPAEVGEAKEFLSQARIDAPSLPAAVRAFSDSELGVLLTMVGRAAPPDSVQARANALIGRIGSAVGGSGTLDPFPSQPPSLARGAAVYREQCLECHGPTGGGDGPKAKRLEGPPPASLADREAMGAVSPVDVYRKVTIGVAGTAMPEFDETLSSGDRWAVATYIATLRADDRMVREGEGLYAAQCAGCHGVAGGGDGSLAAALPVRPPALRDLAVQGRFTDGDMAHLILQGRPGTPMPGFTRTFGRDGADRVTAFLRVLATAERQQSQASPTAATFSAVRRQVDSAVALRSDKLAFDAYLTFEQLETEIRARHAGTAHELEDAFAALRAGAAAGADARELGAVRARIHSGLERAERLVEDKGSSANLFMQSLVLFVREGFEAILIIAALMTFLAKAGATERRRHVAQGAWAAVAASAVTGVAIALLFQITPSQRETLEGVTMLLATAVLFYVSYWLLSKVEVARWNAFVRSRMEEALSTGSGLALSSVAFLAVYREGVETILFYKALLASAQSATAAVLGGILVGVVALALLYLGISRFGLKVPMKPFFAMTSAMLYYMAFVFAGKGIAELQGAGVVPMTVVQWAPRIPFLGIYPTLQSLSLQALLVVLVVVAVVWAQRSRFLAGEERRRPSFP
jgi:high-affinity iron transporter